MGITSKSAAVNLRKGKSSFLILVADADTFASNTEVKNKTAKDTQNPSVDFDAEARWNQGGTKRRLPIRLKGKKQRETDPPETGTLTLTLVTPTQPDLTVNNITVAYVNDDDQP